jgi:hypothetical protein
MLLASDFLTNDTLLEREFYPFLAKEFLLLDFELIDGPSSYSWIS